VSLNLNSWLGGSCNPREIKRGNNGRDKDVELPAIQICKVSKPAKSTWLKKLTKKEKQIRKGNKNKINKIK
jgi:hypothetical protein